MVIRTSGGVDIDVIGGNFVIKNGRLFNANTKSYEGVYGDYVSFTETLPSGGKVAVRGTVDGYTNGSTVKLMGVEQPYENVTDVKVEHLYSVMENNEITVKTETVVID